MNPPRRSALFALAAVQVMAIGTVLAGDVAIENPGVKHPVTVCIVSGEHLRPGEIITYVHKEDGHPDRTIRFCCRKCLARFKADPDRFLRKLDELESGEKNAHQIDR